MGSRGQTQTTSQTIDPRVQGMWSGLYNDVTSYMDANPYQAYQGDLVAGVDPLSTQAQGMLSSGLGGVQQIATDLGGFQAPNVNAGSLLGGPGIGAYMSPYTDSVVNTALSDIDRARQMAQVGNASAATQAGAFGGDRHAIVEAETNRAALDQAARTSAQLRSQGFDTAASLYGQDLNRQMQAGLANQGAALSSGQLQLGAGGLLSSSLLNGTNMLNQFGLQNRDVVQQGLASDYARFQDEQNDPYRRFQFQQGILSGMPYGVTSGVTTPGNAGAGALGGALSGAGIGAQFGPWGAGIGAGIGLLGGLFG